MDFLSYLSQLSASSQFDLVLAMSLNASLDGRQELPDLFVLFREE